MYISGVVCDTVVIINQGEILTISPLEDILEYEGSIVEVRLTEDPTPFVRALEGDGLKVELDGSTVLVFAEDEQTGMDRPMALVIRINARLPFLSLTRPQTRLEAIDAAVRAVR